MAGGKSTDGAHEWTPEESEQAFALIGDRFIDAMIDFRRTIARQALRQKIDHVDGEVLTPALVDALMVVCRRDTWQVQEFAQELGIEQSTATRTLDPLVERGYVTREVDPANRRRKVVRSTARGRRVAGRILDARRRAMRAHLEQMSPGRRTMFVELLEEFVEIVDTTSVGDAAEPHAEMTRRMKVVP
ncbi:MAG: MarR family transcriptional regulator [Acidimicrobiia bacterium]